MHYLNRDARREVIMQAAMRIALKGGFSAMTVRQIAAEAGVSAGQLHHHFASASELKTQTFLRLIREMLDMPLVADDARAYERLFSMLGSADGRLEPYIRLWREALLLADSDEEIKNAYLETMAMWHQQTLTIIEQGVAGGEFQAKDNAADIAWRLIGLVCGLDGIYALGMKEIDDATFSRYIKHYITMELL